MIEIHSPLTSYIIFAAKFDIMNIVFHAHSGLRWLVLAGVVVILLKSIVGLISNGSYGKFDKILGSATVGLMDMQLLLGLVLYFGYSPYTKNLTFNMGNAEERFWSVEHLLLMLLAIVAAHVGKVISKKSQDASVQFKYQTIFFGISLLLMIAGIPWSRI